MALSVAEQAEESTDRPRQAEHRFRSSIWGRSGYGCRLLRQSDRDAGVRPCPASLMSAVDVNNLGERHSL
jgi:hypothetical protein